MGRQKTKRGVKGVEPPAKRQSKRVRGEMPSPLVEVPSGSGNTRKPPVLFPKPGLMLPVPPTPQINEAAEDQNVALDLSPRPLVIEEMAEDAGSDDGDEMADVVGDDGGDGVEEDNENEVDDVDDGEDGHADDKEEEDDDDAEGHADDKEEEDDDDGKKGEDDDEERDEENEGDEEKGDEDDDNVDDNEGGGENEEEKEDVEEEEEKDDDADANDDNNEEEELERDANEEVEDDPPSSTRATASANPRRLVARVAAPGTSASSRQIPVIEAVPVIGSSSRPLRGKGPPPPPKRGRGRPRKNAPLPDDDDDDDDDDGDDSDADPGSKVLAGRRRFRRRPAGTVALKSTKRIVVDNDDPKDLTYEPPADPENDVSEQPVFLFDIRSYKRVCFNVARSLEVLDGEHGPKDEGRQMSAFITKLSEALNLPLERTRSIETDHAIWYCKILRFKDRGMRLSALMQDEDNFLSEFNCSLSSVAKDFRRLLAQTSKPLLLMVGQASIRNENGHCQLLAIQNTERGLRASIKDCLPRPDAVAKTLAMQLLKELKVARVDLVCELNEEEDVTYTECVKEAYRIVGDCLDGRFFWMRKIPGAFKTYNVSRNVQIKPTPEKLSFFL
ncbi:unnamed protein product [Orchesella dallaii]|uniref:Uncharacterized protein n=1 Tax=Orchesella dallaii TaxID=48710 RepID=A0ABP1S0I6_9HEXA